MQSNWQLKRNKCENKVTNLTSDTSRPSDSNFFPYCFRDLVELLVTKTSRLPCNPTDAGHQNYSSLTSLRVYTCVHTRIVISSDLANLVSVCSFATHSDMVSLDRIPCLMVPGTSYGSPHAATTLRGLEVIVLSMWGLEYWPWTEACPESPERHRSACHPSKSHLNPPPDFTLPGSLTTICRI